MIGIWRVVMVLWLGWEDKFLLCGDDYWMVGVGWWSELLVYECVGCGVG